MKQVELAHTLGISKSYLSMILSGQRTASPELEAKISSQLPVNSKARMSLRGRCPKPLDECATLKSWLATLDSSRTFIREEAVCSNLTTAARGISLLYLVAFVKQPELRVNHSDGTCT